MLTAKNDNALPVSMSGLPEVGAGMTPNIEWRRALERQLRGGGDAVLCLVCAHCPDYLKAFDLFYSDAQKMRSV